MSNLPETLSPFATNHPASSAYRMHLSPHEWTWTQAEQEAMALALIERDKELASIRRVAGHVVKHRGHVAGDVAIDNLAALLANK